LDCVSRADFTALARLAATHSVDTTLRHMPSLNPSIVKCEPDDSLTARFQQIVRFAV
jgi:hypothetical protein